MVDFKMVRMKIIDFLKTQTPLLSPFPMETIVLSCSPFPFGFLKEEFMLMSSLLFP